MRIKYIPICQLMVCFLLISLLLQSCFNLDRSIEGKEGVEERGVTPPIIKHVNQETEIRLYYEDGSVKTQKQYPKATFPTTFTSVNKFSYQILPKITVEVAQEVQKQTGLVIPFELGKTTTEFIGGKGNYGQLRLGKDVDTGNYYGVKILQPRSYELKQEARLVEEARKEAQLQSKLCLVLK